MTEAPNLRDRISPPSLTRRRRRRNRKSQSASVTTPDENAQANPSTAIPEGPSMQQNQKQETDEDFIPLPSDSDPESDPEKGDAKLLENERDRPRDRSRERDEGRKRKREVLDFDDRQPNRQKKVDIASRRAPWVHDIDWDSCKNVAEMMHHEVEAFTKWISPTPVEEEIRELTVTLITKAIKASFPDAQVLPFGSYQTKLYLPLGDIDLVIISRSMEYSNKTKILHILASIMKRAGITSHVTIIAQAKVPIIKFITRHGRFHVDISINQGNGVISGQVVTRLLQEMGNSKQGQNPLALRSLILITKAFLNQRGMNEVFTGGLGSYSIVCLAISFLQMHPKVRRGEIDAEQNLGVLVMEFFEYYGRYFNYDEVGISIRDGGTYFSKRRRGWYNSGKRGMLSIEDPIDPTNDISGGSYGFPKVRATLAGAHGILTSTAYLRAGIINSRKQGRSFQLRKHYDAEDLSILSSILGITQETINHRKLVKEIYDNRILHDILQIKPKASVVHDTPVDSGQQFLSSDPSSHSSQTYSYWKELEGGADLNVNHDLQAREDQDMDEMGKYDIGQRQPPRKRRRMDRPEDAHTIFVADSDDGNSSANESIDLAGGKEVLGSGGRNDEGNTASDSNRRRDYWLSKGIGLGEDIGSD